MHKNIMEKPSNTPFMMDALFQKALHAYQLGDNQTTVDLLEEIHRSASQTGQYHPEAQVFLAHQLRHRGDWERAHALYQDTLRRVRPLNIDDRERDHVLGQVFLGLGRVFEMQDKMQAARAAWKRGLGFFRRGQHLQWAQLLEHLLERPTNADKETTQ